ncbi:MAG: hypothetical protein GY777_17440, partial [Candidatus Brocadiaceae bacterium]|nr:hypothetical protein [Candidatus Brocadiaceae bacterium]
MNKATRNALLTKLSTQTIERKATIDTNSAIDIEKRQISFIIVSDDNAGLRYDWWEDEIYEERLDVNGATYGALKRFLKDYDVGCDTGIGSIRNVRVDKGQIKCDVVFGSGDNEMDIFRKYQEGILSDVSIGYSIQDLERTERKNETTEVLITRFDIHELSAVWKGFDSKAQVGRNKEILEKEETPNE